MSQEPRTAEDLIQKVRRDIQDRVQPYLWDDDDLLDYLDEAQKEFCRVGAPILDSRTPEVCEIPYSAEDAEVELHYSVLKIHNAWREDLVTGKYTSLDLVTETNWMELNPQRPTRYGDNLAPDSSFTQSGTVRSLMLDYSSGYIRFARPADVAGNLKLRVNRLPLEDLSDMEDVIEVHRKHEPAVVAFASHLAFLKEDAETFDEKAAARYLQRFLTLADQASVEHIQLHTTPGVVKCSFP